MSIVDRFRGWQQRQVAVYNDPANPVDRYGSIVVYRDHVERAGEIYPLEDVEARVQESGTMVSRGTLTRSLLVHGWQAQQDSRLAFLVMSGPGFFWQEPIKLDNGRDKVNLPPAHRFAGNVNDLARRTDQGAAR